MAILQAHITQTPYLPSALVEINNELEAIILWCLKKEKESRPKNIQELSDRLLPILKTLAASESNLSPKLIVGATIPDVEKFSISDVGSTSVLPGRTSPKKFILMGLAMALVLAAVLIPTGVIKISFGSKEGPKEDPPAVAAPVMAPVAPPPMDMPPPMAAEPKKVTFQLQISPNVTSKIYVDGIEQKSRVFRRTKSDTESITIKVISEGFEVWETKLVPAIDMPVVVNLKKKEAPKDMTTPPPDMKKVQPRVTPRPPRKVMLNEFL